VLKEPLNTNQKSSRGCLNCTDKKNGNIECRLCSERKTVVHDVRTALTENDWCSVENRFIFQHDAMCKRGISRRPIRPLHSCRPIVSKQLKKSSDLFYSLW